MSGHHKWRDLVARTSQRTASAALERRVVEHAEAMARVTDAVVAEQVASHVGRIEGACAGVLGMPGAIAQPSDLDALHSPAHGLPEYVASPALAQPVRIRGV